MVSRYAIQIRYDIEIKISRWPRNDIDDVWIQGLYVQSWRAELESIQVLALENMWYLLVTLVFQIVFSAELWTDDLEMTLKGHGHLSSSTMIVQSWLNVWDNLTTLIGTNPGIALEDNEYLLSSISFLWPDDLELSRSFVLQGHVQKWLKVWHKLNTFGVNPGIAFEYNGVSSSVTDIFSATFWQDNNNNLKHL